MSLSSKDKAMDYEEEWFTCEHNTERKRRRYLQFLNVPIYKDYTQTNPKEVHRVMFIDVLQALIREAFISSVRQGKHGDKIIRMRQYQAWLES